MSTSIIVFVCATHRDLLEQWRWNQRMGILSPSSPRDFGSTGTGCQQNDVPKANPSNSATFQADRRRRFVVSIGISTSIPCMDKHTLWRPLGNMNEKQVTWKHQSRNPARIRHLVCGRNSGALNHPIDSSFHDAHRLQPICILRNWPAFRLQQYVLCALVPHLCEVFNSTG
jgi:hypothetical protein